MLLSFLTNFAAWIFKVGKRGSPNYYRVYQNQTQIRFELDQRGATIKLAQKLIFQDHVEEFERIMTKKSFLTIQKEFWKLIKIILSD